MWQRPRTRQLPAPQMLNGNLQLLESSNCRVLTPENLRIMKPWASRDVRRIFFS